MNPWLNFSCTLGRGGTSSQPNYLRPSKKMPGWLRKNIKSVLRRFEKRAGKDMIAAGSGATRQVNRNRVMSFLEAARVGHLDRRNLHEYRLKIKELRDALFTRPVPDPRFTDALSQAQDAIGEWHDWEELLSIGKEVLEHGPSCKLLGALKTKSRQKH